MITNKEFVLKCFCRIEYEERTIYPSDVKSLKKVNQLTYIENTLIYTNYFGFK